MNTASAKYDLVQNCKDREYREALNVENVYARICSRIRILREQRDLSQKQFGKVAKMAQERISILEDPNADTKPTLNTLLRLACALDVGLDVDFVPFSRVIDRSVDTGTDMDGVPPFDSEVAVLEQRLADQVKAGVAHPPNPALGISLSSTALMGQQQFISCFPYEPQLNLGFGRTQQGYSAVMSVINRPGPELVDEFGVPFSKRPNGIPVSAIRTGAPDITNAVALGHAIETSVALNNTVSPQTPPGISPDSYRGLSGVPERSTHQARRGQGPRRRSASAHARGGGRKFSRGRRMVA